MRNRKALRKKIDGQIHAGNIRLGMAGGGVSIALPSAGAAAGISITGCAIRPVGNLEGELQQNDALISDLFNAVSGHRARLEVALRPAPEPGTPTGGTEPGRPAGSQLTMQARDLNSRLADAIRQIRDITDRVDV